MTNAKQFVKVWMTSDTLETAAKRLNITNQAASARATLLRHKGVKLPRMSAAPHNTFSVEELNALVAKYSNK